MGVKLAFVLGEGAVVETNPLVRRAQKMGALLAGEGEMPKIGMLIFR